MRRTFHQITHTSEENDDNKTTKNEEENSNNSSNSEQKETNSTDKDDDTSSKYSDKVSQASQENSCSKIINEHDTYRIKSGQYEGQLGCKRCSLRGDRFDMQNISCRKNKK